MQGGENRGRTLKHHTIAKKMEVIGDWNGKQEVTQYSLKRPDDADIEGRCVIRANQADWFCDRVCPV